MTNITDLSIARAEKALERRYQDRIESEDANRFEAEIHETLKVQMLAAMVMGESAETLPFVHRGHAGAPDRETFQSINDAVMECLDYYEVNEILHKVLAESTCPIIKELRLAIAKRYADNNAADLAAVRSEA